MLAAPSGVQVRHQPAAHRGFELSPDIIELRFRSAPNDRMPRSISRLYVPMARVFIMTSWLPGHRIRPAFVPENSKSHRNASLRALFASSPLRE